jgi:hypothetical protein
MPIDQPTDATTEQQFMPPRPPIPIERRIPQQQMMMPPGGGGPTDPAYQDQLEGQQMAIYRQAKNVAQAEKDVASARRMLGILNADRDVASGVPVDKAIYKNLPFLVSPSEKGAMANYRNLRPVPPPYQQNFQVGTNQVPAVITPGPGGAQRTQFIPQSAIPKPAFKPNVQELEPGLRAAQLGPNKYQLLKEGGPDKLSDLDKIRAHGLYAELGQIRKKKADEVARASGLFGMVGGPRKDVIKQLDDREKEITSELKQFGSDRVRVKKKVNGKWVTGTVPRHQLQSAVDEEGYAAEEEAGGE